MAVRARQASLIVGLLFASAGARAQTAPPAGSARPSVLPPVPELRLSWPVAPRAYSYTESELGGYATGPLQLFRVESLWLETPRLQLWTFTSSERAFELDCRLTCAPIVRRGFGLEGRVVLPRLSPLVTDPHVFVQASRFRAVSGPRATGLLQAGLAGALDF